MHNVLRTLAILMILLLGSLSILVAQPRFEVPITSTDDVNSQTHYFGILQVANTCVALTDSINGHVETFWPPVPPSGVFDARYVWPRSGSNQGCYDQGTPHDFRPFTSYAQRDTFKIASQMGSGSTIILSWPSGLSTRFAQLTLKFVGSNGAVFINMLDTTAADITDAGNPAIAFIYSGGLVGPPPAPPTLLNPTNGATNVTPLPTFQWSSVSGASYYRLQVAEDSTFAVTVYDDSSVVGTSRQSTQLATNTRYYWRVACRNPQGTGVFSTAFRFTTAVTPPSPLLLAPPDSALRLSRTATLLWASVFSATAYHVQVASNPQFTSLQFNDSTIVDTSATLPPMPYGARLYWRVRAKVGTLASIYSNPRTFTVMLEPPGMPTLLAPPNNTPDVPVSTTLTWGSVSLASLYNLQIAYDTLMSNLMLNDTAVVLPSWPARLQPSTTFFWRVRGRNTENTYGPYSGIWHFTTGNFAPAIPVPTFPANGDTGITRTTTLQWLGSPGASTYRAQIARDSLFGQLLQDDSTIAGTTLTTVPLPSRTTCFWRVRAKGTAGSSAYCTVQRFSTGTYVGVEGNEEASLPTQYALHQNYPNPFNPATVIAFDVPTTLYVTLSIFDLLGREVAMLVDGLENVGRHEVRWNATDLAGGVYYCRLTAGTYTKTTKLVLLK
jgi:hypothetical protein